MRKPAQITVSHSNEEFPLPATSETLLTVPQVAARYQTGREEVHRWIRARKLEAFRIGKLVRIRPVALAEFERRHLSSTESKR